MTSDANDTLSHTNEIRFHPVIAMKRAAKLLGTSEFQIGQRKAGNKTRTCHIHSCDGMTVTVTMEMAGGRMRMGEDGGGWRRKRIENVYHLERLW